jgi:hypothetical protein
VCSGFTFGAVMHVFVCLDSFGTPGSAVPSLVVPETASPASQREEVVVATPALSCSQRTQPVPAPSDPVLAQTLKANEAGLRKRRLAHNLSPEIQVFEPSPKHRLLSAKLNISQLF